MKRQFETMDKQRIIDAFKRHVTIRYSSVADKNVPVSTLQRIADDEHWWIRKAAARNISTPTPTLNKLAWDAHPEVRKAAITNLKSWVREEMVREDND